MALAGTTDRPQLDFRGALRRYPFPILAAALLTLWIIADYFEIRSWLRNGGWAGSIPGLRLLRDIVPMLIAAFFTTTATGFATLNRPRWLSWTAQAAAFAGGMALATGVDANAGLLMLLSLACAISLAAGVAARGGSRRYWLANAGLALSLAAITCAAAIATLGGGIILAAAETLLGLRVRAVSDVLLVFTWGFLLPLFWLALARFDDPAQVDGRGLTIRVVAVATDALLIPLMLVFSLVIHVYAARIAILSELPKGQIGWIVPVYLGVGYGIYLLADGPASHLPRLRGLFRRLFVVSTLIPLILLALAVAVRIRAYGVTEERYLLALVVFGGSLLATLAALRRPFEIRFAPAITGALALLAAIGPFSALNMAIRSQTERARAILATVPPERWASERDGGLSKDDQEKLLGAVQHLQSRAPGALDPLASRWPPDVPMRSWDLKKRFSGDPGMPSTLAFATPVVLRLSTITLVDTFHLFGSEGTTTVGSAGEPFRIEAQDRWLTVSGDGQTTRFDLSPFLAADAPRPSNVLSSVEGRRGELIVSEVERNNGRGGMHLRALRARVVLSTD